MRQPSTEEVGMLGRIAGYRAVIDMEYDDLLSAFEVEQAPAVPA